MEKDNLLREKQNELKVAPNCIPLSGEDVKYMTELLEYKKICSISELKTLCEDAERYAELDEELFLFSEEISEKNYLEREILEMLTGIAKRYKSEDERTNEVRENENRSF